MKILKISYEFPPIGGGGSRVVHGLARQLVQSGHSVDLVTMGFRNLPKFEIVDGINVHRIPCIRRSESICRPYEMATYLLSATPKINRLVKENNYDINHTHFIFPDALLSTGLKRWSGLPFVVTAHGSDVPGYNPNRFISLHKILKPAWRKVVTSADRVISPSRSLAELIKNHLKSAEIEIIPNGINIPSFNYSKRKTNRVLVVSRIFARKGIQHLLYALEGFNFPINVDIVGEGPHLNELKNIAKGLETQAKIHFYGWIDNESPRLRELYEEANIFILPSESENFPIVLLEAMSANLAVITTEGTGCEEVVENTGLLVPPNDSKSLRRSLIKLIENPDLCEELGRAAHDRLVNKFGWGVVTNQYIQVYEDVIGR
ncbi:MAG: glycosyltransferase family 4 protein [Anaerolineales bacterium]|jgi:glycosyltransferase involved in cell wall biosynthesis